MMSLFCEILKRCRKTKGITQKDLATALGMKERGIRYYESGEREPDIDGLVAIADFFEVSLDYLVGRSGDPTMR